MIKAVLIVIALILGVPIGIVLGIVIKGYLMYRIAFHRKPLKRAVEEIRNNPSFVPFEQISMDFIYVLLIAEDKFLFQHNGYRIKGIYRALKYNWKMKRIVTGASTISQQLVKNLFFTFKKIYSRKVAEIFAVRKLEAYLSKEEILELYCNCIEYGEGIYGIKNACEYYFGILPSELTVKEAVELAAVLPSPKRYLLKQNNELFQMSKANILKCVVNQVAPEDQEYFLAYGDVPEERRKEYSELHRKDYLKRKKDHDCIRTLFADAPFRRKDR